MHFASAYGDADRARAFCSDVLGWAIQRMPEIEYDSEDIGRSRTTIAVDDMTTALATIAEHGGAAIGEPQHVGDMGISSYYR